MNQKIAVGNQHSCMIGTVNNSHKHDKLYVWGSLQNLV